MSALERPLVVVGDVHLTHGGSPDAALALARLVERHAGHEIVLNGDIFNLSLDPPARDPVESMVTMLAPHEKLCAALRNHLATGAPGSGLVLLPGNHDADIGRPGVRDALLACLELGQDAAFSVAPWLVRRGGVHVEHGHVYDPDNAPTHPLAPPVPATEPLGVALTRRFLAPNRAFDFAHATEITPLAGLKRALQVFGPRTPLLLARYFAESGRFCHEARWRPELQSEKKAGEARVDAVARDTGLDAAVLRALDDDRPRPTHESFERAFFRLYFDRVFATLSIGGGALGAVVRSSTALGVGALAALYLVESVRRGTNRYEGLPVKRLRAAASRVREISNAQLVVFGHTHVYETEPGYLNPGSFTYRAEDGRPYAFIDEHGQAERRAI